MDSVGNINSYLGLVEELKPSRQRRILVREMLIALVMMFIFHYFGELLFYILDLHPATVRVSGGIILFLIAIKMVFPNDNPVAAVLEKDEPFITPIATPMIAGPSALVTVMLYANEEPSALKVLAAIVVAWSASVIVLASARTLQYRLGDKALLAVERLMGLILTLMAMEMLLKGVRLYIDAV